MTLRKGHLTEIQKWEKCHRLVMTPKFPCTQNENTSNLPRSWDTGQAGSPQLCPSPLTMAILKPRLQIGVQRSTSESHSAMTEKHLKLYGHLPHQTSPCLSPLSLAYISPHNTPITAAAIILANFALAMWTVGWFLLYFVALSNIS